MLKLKKYSLVVSHSLATIARHCFSLHLCFRFPRPPNFFLSRQLIHCPQSGAKHPVHWPQVSCRLPPVVLNIKTLEIEEHMYIPFVASDIFLQLVWLLLVSLLCPTSSQEASLLCPTAATFTLCCFAGWTLTGCITFLFSAAAYIPHDKNKSHTAANSTFTFSALEPTLCFALDLVGLHLGSVEH